MIRFECSQSKRPHQSTKHSITVWKFLTQRIPALIQADAQVYAPFEVQSYTLQAPEMFHQVCSSYFQLLLHDDMVFECAIAFSLVMQRMHLEIDARESVDILHHAQNALMKLRKRVTSDASSNAVLLTVIMLATISVSADLLSLPFLTCTAHASQIRCFCRSCCCIATDCRYSWWI